ncbi:MAG: hypothetical protein J7J86_09875 [Bacteroidales bacterium]|nr:hypothetical protein [Bacteroidales bacterium]
MKKFIIFLFCIILFSCSSKPEFEKHISFKNNSWYRFKKLNFEIPVNKLNRDYDLFFTIKYNSDLTVNRLPLHVIIDTPSGEERIMEYKLKLLDKNDKPLGEKQNNFWTVELKLREDFSFHKKGICKIEIENLNPKIETSGIIEAVLSMKKAK